MAGKILAAALLLFGGSVTLYIVYRTVLGLLQPTIPKKPGYNQKPPQNNLQLQQQPVNNQAVKKK